MRQSCKAFAYPSWRAFFARDSLRRSASCSLVVMISPLKHTPHLALRDEQPIKRSSKLDESVFLPHWVDPDMLEHLCTTLLLLLIQTGPGMSHLSAPASSSLEELLELLEADSNSSSSSLPSSLDASPSDSKRVSAPGSKLTPDEGCRGP